MKADLPPGSEVTGRTAAEEWRFGWLLVLASLVAYGTATIYTFSLGLFMAPLQKEFGWTRAMISSGMLLAATLTGLAAPFAGRLIDIYGARRIGLAGMTIYCFAIAMLGSTSSSIEHWWALWGLLACGSLFTKPTVWISAITKNFTASRGMALAITMSGSGIAAALAPSVAHALIEHLGWRMAYAALGGGLFVLNMPLIWLFFYDRGRNADGSASTVAPVLAGYDIKPSMMSRRYIQLGVIAFVMTAGITGLQVHFVPILASLGVSRAEAAAAAGLIGIGAIIGRLVTGYMLDRLPGPLVGGVSFLIPVVASLILLFPIGLDAVLAGSIAAFVFGLALGAEIDILAYLTGRYFGNKNYGTLFGTLVGLLALSNGVGPTLAGYLFDISGNYAWFLGLTIGAFALAALMVSTLGPYPADFENQGH